jgi:hypothetical protein
MNTAPPHPKRVRVPFATVATGYGGERAIKQAGPGLWQIIGADPSDEQPYDARYTVTIGLIVAPARGGK